MSYKNFFSLVTTLFALGVAFYPTNLQSAPYTIASGETIELKTPVEQLICSGPGCLRLVTYLQAEDKVVAVDSIEKKKQFEARPYAISNPEYRQLPLFGEFRGFDSPELIVSLEKQPQVIFKTFWESGFNYKLLKEKTGIPVVTLNYGHLVKDRDALFETLRIMGQITGKEERAEELITFMTETINDLTERTKDIQSRKSCYVGGIAYKGPHNIESTEPNYPPFVFTNAANVVYEGKNLENTIISKEKLLEWDPSVIFIDLSTLQMEAGAVNTIKTDPAYQLLTAVKTGEVYGVLPYNWYTQNFGSILADSYFIGKILYPSQFEDIDPVKKADEIYSFLLGKGVFNEVNAQFGNLAFTQISLEN